MAVYTKLSESKLKELFSKYNLGKLLNYSEIKDIINSAKKYSEKTILENTKKFHQIMDDRKKNAEQKIIRMKENALKDVKNISIKISIEAVEHLIKNSIDKNKIEKLYIKSLEQAKTSLKNLKA